MAVTTARQMRIYRALLALADREEMPVTPRDVAMFAAEADRVADQPRPADALPPGRPQRPARPGPPPRGEVVPAPQLTGEQVELLRALEAHRTRAGLGSALGASEAAVKGRLSRLYRALGVSSRAGALEAGRRLGVLDGTEAVSS